MFITLIYLIFVRIQQTTAQIQQTIARIQQTTAQIQQTIARIQYRASSLIAICNSYLIFAKLGAPLSRFADEDSLRSP